MRRSKKGGSIYTRIGAWRGSNSVIHMTIEGVKGQIAVRPDADKPSGHPKLYDYLDRMLKDTTIPRGQRPRLIKIQFVAADGTVTKGPSFKLPSST
jgi:hypothetical protein